MYVYTNTLNETINWRCNDMYLIRGRDKYLQNWISSIIKTILIDV